MARLPYGRQDLTEEDIRSVVECLRGDWLTQGPRVAAFEEALCEAVGARYAVAVSSGTAALHLGALALNVQPGDIGITSPITFVASANALRYAGAAVAFADVDRRTGLVDVPALERRAESLASAGRPPSLIIPVDFAGQPPDLAEVRRVADRFGARVLEDAAHALGARFTDARGEHRVGDGTYSHATILSFHPVKHVTTGEGGALLTSDEGVYRRALALRSHGIHNAAGRITRSEDDPFVGPWYYEQQELGFNYRITDIQCALGISQLTRLSRFVQRRRELAARYDAAFSRPPFSEALRPLARRPHSESAFHLYVIQLEAHSREPLASVAARRKALYLHLQSRDIFTQVHYIPVPWHPYHRSQAGDAGRFPEAEAYYAASLSLPLFPAMRDQDVDQVTDAIADWLKGA